MPNILEGIKRYSEEKYDRFFRDEYAESAAASLQEVREASEWMSQAYHAKFLVWLNEQSSKLPNTDVAHATLIEAVTRAKVFKEVEEYLSKLDVHTKEALQGFRDGD